MDTIKVMADRIEVTLEKRILELTKQGIKITFESVDNDIRISAKLNSFECGATIKRDGNIFDALRAVELRVRGGE